MRDTARTLGALVVFLLFAVPPFCSAGASAQTSVPPKPGCENAKTQLEMNQCTAAAYQTSDQELNSVYASVKDKLDAALLEKLQIAQRAWIKYRDANCEAESALYDGGSIRPAIYSACMERVTRARIAELHAIYDTGTR